MMREVKNGNQGKIGMKTGIHDDDGLMDCS